MKRRVERMKKKIFEWFNFWSFPYTLLGTDGDHMIGWVLPESHFRKIKSWLDITVSIRGD